ncbi:MAG: hypothetical protein Q8932_16680 [Bacteroidota bacterium]|nr:hypothetical protein [Bacteroidota bacterium]
MPTCHKLTAILAFVLSSFTSLSSHAAENTPNPTNDLRAEVESINTRFGDCAEKAKVDSLMDFYTRDVIFLPEYKQAIFGIVDLTKFYEDWFSAVKIGSYKKEIYKLEQLPGYVLEIGHLSVGYAIKGGTEPEGGTMGTANVYSAKYMIMWKRNRQGRLRIISEAFGSDKMINPEEMPYAMVQVKDNPGLKGNHLSKELEPEILAFDSALVKCILQGDGETRASQFAPDGIYMPHFDKMLVGMDALRPYMIRTYRPNSIANVKNTYREILNLGDYVFIDGHFTVGIDNGRVKGTFEGNMSNLMKRGPDGKLRMYCQLAHNDSLPRIN